MVQRHRRHRQHPALGPEQPADEVEPADGVAEQLPEGDDEQVAEGVPAERSRRRRTGAAARRARCWPHSLSLAQRGQRHPQVARRQDAELVAQPAGGAAVVGDRDDRGDLVGDAAAGR